MIDSYINRKETDLWQWFGLAIHMTWNFFVFRQLDSPWLAVLVASCV